MAAANHFSAKMSNPLAESTVRNFVRALSDSISSEDKNEIGKFAFEFGIDECIDAFKEKHVSQSFSSHSSSLFTNLTKLVLTFS